MRAGLLIFMRDEKGAGAVEYALIAGAIATIVIGGAAQLGLHVGDYFAMIADRLP